jgi:hypothetical protein
MIRSSVRPHGDFFDELCHDYFTDNLTTENNTLTDNQVCQVKGIANTGNSELSAQMTTNGAIKIKLRTAIITRVAIKIFFIVYSVTVSNDSTTKCMTGSLTSS